MLTRVVVVQPLFFVVESADNSISKPVCASASNGQAVSANGELIAELVSAFQTLLPTILQIIALFGKTATPAATT